MSREATSCDVIGGEINEATSLVGSHSGGRSQIGCLIVMFGLFSPAYFAKVELEKNSIIQKIIIFFGVNGYERGH